MTTSEFDYTENDTRVVHCKMESYNLYIGSPSKWGNPFSVSSNTRAQYKVNSKEEAIEKYREWITIGGGKHLLNDLHELKGKTLGCWCKPSNCHGDILCDLINHNQSFIP